MKKLFLLGILLLGMFSGMTQVSALSPVACTMEAKLCDDGKTWVGRTGPNCEFSACPGDIGLCPEALPPACENGYKITGYNYDKNGCKSEKYECKDDISICTSEYAPVCGSISETVCESNDEGSYCKSASYLKTFSNKCELNKVDARYMYKGQCRTDAKVCPVYDLPEVKNGCYYNFVKEAGCTVPKLVCQDNNDDLPIKIKRLADQALKKYEMRLQEIEIEDSEKVQKIETLISKLENIYGPDKSKNVNALIKYLIRGLEEMKNLFQDDGIDDILNIFK